MTYEQAITLTTLISAAQGVSFTDESKIRAWYSLLDDLDFKTAHLALKKLLRSEEFNITPAHIRNMCAELEHGPAITIDAVSIISKAISLFGKCNVEGDRKRYEKCMEYIKAQDSTLCEIVKSIGWQNICNGNPNFIRPEIERLYNEANKAKQQNRSLPESLKLAISDFRSRLVCNNLAALTVDYD